MNGLQHGRQGLDIQEHADLPTKEEMDALIASEMSRLSVEERERVYDDVHGVGTFNEEDPSFIGSCLDDLANHLLTQKQGTAYAIAESMSKQYVSDKDFCMMFLRAEEYDPSDAAERMIRFFEFKKELFGVEKLVKDIALDDMDEDDMHFLGNGYCQVSPYTDTAGRTIFVFIQKRKTLGKTYGYESLSRALYYLFLSAAELPNAGLGIVAVYYLLDVPDGKSMGSKLRSAIPVRLASVQVCTNNTTQVSRIQPALKKLGTKGRVRYRMHYGSHEECQSSLNSFGIPRGAIPVTQEGDFLTEHWTNQYMQWLQERRKVEKERAPKEISLVGLERSESPVTSSASPLISTTLVSVTPLPPDVLFGRGRVAVDHPGNMRFRYMVDLYMDKYEAAGRVQKSCLTEIILRMIQNASGRFLKRDDGIHWEEVDDMTAKKKIAHAFRNRRKFHGYS